MSECSDIPMTTYWVALTRTWNWMNCISPFDMQYDLHLICKQQLRLARNQDKTACHKSLYNLTAIWSSMNCIFDIYLTHFSRERFILRKNIFLSHFCMTFFSIYLQLVCKFAYDRLTFLFYNMTFQSVLASRRRTFIGVLWVYSIWFTYQKYELRHILWLHIPSDLLCTST